MSEINSQETIQAMIKKNQRRYSSTNQFLKDKKLNQASYFVVIGPPGSGKTTLLKNAELKYVLERKIPSIDHIKPTISYDWWVTKKTIFIDSPGRDFIEDSPIANQTQNHFLEFLSARCCKKDLSGIVLVLNIDSLLQQKTTQQLEGYFSPINRQLQKCYKKFKGKPPITLIINKLDLVTGFREFFGELSRNERWQRWGIPLSSGADISTQFSNQFQNLMDRLNQQLIWRLQHELNLDKKILINDFPLQMKQIKNQLISFFQTWEKRCGNKFNLQQLFFTAATQKPIANPLFSNTGSTHSQLINIQKPTSHAYFVHDLFQQDLLESAKLTEENVLKQKGKLLLKIVISMMMLSFVGLFAVLWTSSYKDQIKHINAAQLAITTFHVVSQEKSSSKNFSSRLKSIKYLQDATHSFNKDSTRLPAAIVPHDALHNIQYRTNLVYQNALHQFILPKVNSVLIDLLSDSQTPADIQYVGLKAYLMLTQQKHYDAKGLIDLLESIWTADYPNAKNDAIFTYFNDLFTNTPITLKANDEVIANARDHLLQLNVNDLAYAIFLSSLLNYQVLSLNLENNISAASVFTFADPQIHINSLYTANHYQIINPLLFQEAAMSALQGNWVLGEKANNQRSSISAITNSVKSQYLKSYSDAWLAFLGNIKIVNFTEINQLNQALAVLSEDNSLLIQFANLIKNNIVTEAFSNNSQLNNLAYLVQRGPDKKISVQSAVKILNQLHNDINSIATNSDPNKQAFELTSYRMRNNGHDDAIESLFSMAALFPEPLKGWLYSIASNAWQIMLFQSQQYINSQWRQNITPQFDAQLANRFPLQDNASRDVTLESFTYFFSPNGLLDRFFIQYLEPFINRTEIPWKVKNIDGNSLQISNETLANLQKIYTIQHTYFRNNDQQLFVPFTIEPTEISDNVNALNITLGQQSFTFDNETPFMKNAFIWPDDFNSNLCQIIFTENNQDPEDAERDNQTTVSCNGPWGLFKLLNQSQLTTTNERDTYAVTITQNGDTTDLLLTANQAQNPFSLKLLNNFHLPNTIN